MKRLLLSSVAILGLAGTAMAADLPEPTPPVEVAPAPIAPVFNWTGAYLGANIGGVFGNGKINGVDWGNQFGASTSTSGVIGGVYAGYNYSITPLFLVGAETDISFSNNEDKGTLYTTGIPSGVNYRQTNSYVGTVRARAGLTFDRFLVYATGGLAYGDNEVRVRDVANGNTIKKDGTNVGWTVGGGVEGGITQNLIGRVEYLYTDLGNVSFGSSAGGFGTSAKADLSNNIVRAGLAYKF